METTDFEVHIKICNSNRNFPKTKYCYMINIVQADFLLNFGFFINF